MIPAVIYARFSSSAQREQSIEQQEAVCRSYAEHNGFSVLRVYADRALTGRTDQRPQFQQLIRDSSSGTFQAVLVYALDRFSRDRYDHAVYKHELKQHGVRVVSATEPISDDPAGILMESVLEGLAQYYSAELAQKIRRGCEDNAMKCLATGSICYGFRRSAAGHYVIHPEEAAVVREIFTRVDSGDSFADICRDLNARGLRTKSGAEWNRSSFNRLLSNNRYIGTFVSKYHTQADAIPLIVPKDLFFRVQALLPEKSRPRGSSARRRTPNGLFLLSGRLFCECGQAMTGISGTSKSGKLCFYYSCRGHREHTGSRRNIPRDHLEALVFSALRDEALTDDCLRWMAHETIVHQQQVSGPSDLSLLRSQLEQARKEKANVLKAITAGIFTDSTRELLLNLEQREQSLTAQVAAAESALADQLTEDDIISYLEIFRDAPQDLPSTRQGLLDAFVRRAVVHSDRITVFFSIKKEDRQKDIIFADPSPELSSFSSVKWSCRDPKRTLSFYDGYFIFEICA